MATYIWLYLSDVYQHIELFYHQLSSGSITFSYEADNLSVIYQSYIGCSFLIMLRLYSVEAHEQIIQMQHKPCNYWLFIIVYAFGMIINQEMLAANSTWCIFFLYILKFSHVCIFASYFIISLIFSSLSKLSSMCWFFSLQVIVPLPSWDSNTKKPLTSDPEKYAIETELIFKYSPFKDEQQLMEQFNKIESSSGKHMHLSQCK